MMKLMLAIFEAIPIIDKWFQKIVVAYAEVQREKNNVEFDNALELAKKKKDVSALSAHIGDKLD